MNRFTRSPKTPPSCHSSGFHFSVYPSVCGSNRHSLPDADAIAVPVHSIRSAKVKVQKGQVTGQTYVHIANCDTTHIGDF